MIYLLQPPEAVLGLQMCATHLASPVVLVVYINNLALSCVLQLFCGGILYLGTSNLGSCLAHFMCRSMPMHGRQPVESCLAGMKSQHHFPRIGRGDQEGRLMYVLDHFR
jgi:hypothetical protein